jgi:hypothetical protein
MKSQQTVKNMTTHPHQSFRKKKSINQTANWKRRNIKGKLNRKKKTYNQQSSKKGKKNQSVKKSYKDVFPICFFSIVVLVADVSWCHKSSKVTSLFFFSHLFRCSIHFVCFFSCFFLKTTTGLRRSSYFSRLFRGTFSFFFFFHNPVFIWWPMMLSVY